MENQVECHAGYAYAERPTAIHWGGERFEIEALIAEWRIPTGKRFRVAIPDGRIFELFYDQGLDRWEVRES